MPVRPGAVVLALLVFLVVGCSSSSTITGHVTNCNGEPMKGSVLFSPYGEGAANTGPAVGALLKDGAYEIHVQTVGKHRVTVSPADIKYPAPPGYEYPCDLTPQTQEVKAGANTIDIKLPSRR